MNTPSTTAARNRNIFVDRYVSRFFNSPIGNRLVALLLITTLLTPFFLFVDRQKASAFSNSSAAQQQQAPVSAPPAPPQPFVAGVENYSVVPLAFTTTIAAIGEFFTAPPAPEGLEMVKPVSPFSIFLATSGTSMMAALGFIMTPASSPVIYRFTPVNATSPVNAAPFGQLAASVDFDFDHDGKADIGIWRASAAQYQVKKSNGGSLQTASVGNSDSKIAPGDYDGNGYTDFAVYNNGTLSIQYNPSGTQGTLTLGGGGPFGGPPPAGPDDIMVTGDYDGDGISDLAAVRPSYSSLYWVIRSSSTGATSYAAFGSPGDIIAPGKYDSDGKTDIAVFRPSNGNWYILNSSNSTTSTYTFGISTDVPVPGDYDGDGRTDIAVFRESTGAWYVLKSFGNFTTSISVFWGNYGDQPVPADYDGDGKTDYAIWRPRQGVWHIKLSASTNDYRALGSRTDVPVEAAYVKKITSDVFSYDFAKDRLSPKNETGGTNYYSQNFSWGTNLVRLPGRSGLDASLGIAYNSLVWTKDTTHNNTMYFDADYGTPSPGFRFGFPVIEPTYYNDQNESYNFIMIKSSGERVEFRQAAASNIYETADSTYMQLKINGSSNPNDPSENLTLTVTDTNGTQMYYEWKAGAYRCQQIKDRNGNYITINHDDLGVLRTITDTLGRVITVGYDDMLSLSTITQTWKDTNGGGTNMTHTYATFAYEYKTLNFSFSSATAGIYNGGTVRVLKSITYDDGSKTVFEHNSYGQVSKISSFAANSDPLNYVETNLASVSGTQSDCPRLTQTKSQATNFNNSQPVTVTNSNPAYSGFTLPGSIEGAGAKVEVKMTGHPNGLASNVYFGNSGYKEGLPLATEDFATENSVSVRKRWTWNSWTQDNPNTSLLLNPRVVETRVGDEVTTKRTTISYYGTPGVPNVSLYGLVSSSTVYDADLSTPLKTISYQYNQDTNYISRRIIGLPTIVNMGDGSGLLSLMTYDYDQCNLPNNTQCNFSDSTLEQNIPSAVQHDNTNYGSSFQVGRGNLTSMTRWDVNNPTTPSYASVSKTIYNTTGAPVAQIDPMGRRAKISYTDSFKGGTGPNVFPVTYAYPTTLTDPAGYSSQIQYRYDIGANVWAKSPAPVGNLSGKETTRDYDAVAGRLMKETIVNTGAYTLYDYPTNGVQSLVHSTIVDANNSNTVDSGDEVLSETWTDGAGRVIRSRTEHPGSSGGYSGQLTEYDIAGRVTRQSVPTEIDANWNPAGDDYIRGFAWTQQTYDWKDRVKRIIPSDSDGSGDGKDQLFSYEGCGCAGVQVTTIMGESVPVPGQSNSARRTQKIYNDILGRTRKTEILNWDGTTPYTTTTQTFNGRDQATLVRQYAGAEGSSTYQDVTMTYDGHGRMKTRHYPIENTMTETTWSYNADDTMSQVIDPRGVITGFTYDNRGLVSAIGYTLPSGSTIPNASNVSFTYDALGNRVTMNDGLGNVSYEYDELSRLKAETRNFSDALTGAPLPNNGYRLEYGYDLSGGLQWVKDPFGKQVDYTRDKVGRLAKVGGTPFGDNTTGEYLDGISYRAFGAVKQMTLKTTDSNQVSMQYDNRLRVTQHQVTSAHATGGYVQQAEFTYYKDSRSQAMNNMVNHQFDRVFSFDHAGRLASNQFGSSQAGIPYLQTIQYDAFSQMTDRSTTHWGMFNGFTAAFTNGRKQAVGAQTPVYDAAGNLLNSGTRPDGAFQSTTFDAANRQKTISTRYRRNYGRNAVFTFEEGLTQGYDGDGNAIKATETWQRLNVNPPEQTAENKYQVWSSVLKSALTELSSTGAKIKTKVFAGGAVVAEQVRYITGDTVDWISADPVTGSSARLKKTGQFIDEERKELEPLGQEVMPVEPTQTMPVPTSGESSITAEEPEWLCGLVQGQAFWDQPIQCQISQIENLKKPITELLSSGTENNPDRISHSDAGSRKPSQSAGGSSLPSNPASTSKPQENIGPGNSGAIPRSSVPSESILAYVQSEGVEEDPVEQYFMAENGSSVDNPLKNLTAFLSKKGANCLNALDKLGLKNDFLKTIKNTKIENASGEHPDLDKTFRELGAKTLKEEYLNQTLRERRDRPTTGVLAEAVTIWDANKIYLFGPYYKLDIIHRGATVFHEALHQYFKGGHVVVAEKFSLSFEKKVVTMITHPDIRNQNVTNELVFDFSETNASVAIEEWIAKGCNK